MPGQSILFHAHSPNDRSAQGNYSFQVVRRRRARALVSFNHLCDQSHISILPKYFISFTCAILHLHTPGLASWKVHDESGTAPHGRWWYSPANSLRSLSVVSIMIIAIFFFHRRSSQRPIDRTCAPNDDSSRSEQWTVATMVTASHSKIYAFQNV